MQTVVAQHNRKDLKGSYDVINELNGELSHDHPGETHIECPVRCAGAIREWLEETFNATVQIHGSEAPDNIDRLYLVIGGEG